MVFERGPCWNALNFTERNDFDDITGFHRRKVVDFQYREKHIVNDGRPQRFTRNNGDSPFYTGINNKAFPVISEMAAINASMSAFSKFRVTASGLFWARKSVISKGFTMKKEITVSNGIILNLTLHC